VGLIEIGLEEFLSTDCFVYQQSAENLCEERHKW
jgi:hypothetical protein